MGVELNFDLSLKLNSAQMEELNKTNLSRAHLN